jgi:hypothetical protein
MTSKQFYDEDGTPTIKEYHESIKEFFSYVEDHPELKKVEAFNNVKCFIKEAYDLGCGDDSLYRDYHPDEVIERLHNFSDRALILEDHGLGKDQVMLIKHVFDDYVAGHPNEEMVSKKEMETIFEQLDGLGEADYNDL